MKLSRTEIKNHEKCLNILEKNVLEIEDKLFLFEHYREDYKQDNSSFGAFFTPIELANDFSIETIIYKKNLKILDLCSGIGILSYFTKQANLSCKDIDITCVEINHDYLKVGKQILPEANWIHKDVFEFNTEEKFDIVISNPPFGKFPKKFSDNLPLKTFPFEQNLMYHAMKFSNFGVFIVPSSSSPYLFSRKKMSEENKNHSFLKFKEKMKEQNCEISFNCGLDTSLYKDKWKGTIQVPEIIIVEKNQNI